MSGSSTASVRSHPPSEPSSLAEDPRWLLARRIAASEIFSRSEFLPKFLLYICRFYLLDQADEIREQSIGVRVFGRTPSYNPGDDNVVRNYAVQLRKRLSLYFEQQGADEPLRIEIPRGGYVPVFLSNAVTEVAQAPVLVRDTQNPVPAMHPPAPAPSRHADWRMFLLGVAMGAILLGGIAYRWFPYRATSLQTVATHPLWSILFSKDRDTLIVPADAGLGILQNLAKTPASLTDYVNGEYVADVKAKGLDQGNLDDLRTQRYTSMVDLNITSRLSHLPEVVPEHLFVRFARDLRMDDLKDNNVIMLGAIHTDPWVSLLQSGLNFQFACGKQVDNCYIVNSHPTAGESSVYRGSSNSASPETYAILALLPNLNHTGWILLVEGLNMAGTEAAANMLLEDATMRPLIRQSTSSAGSLKPWELLIRTKSLGAQALPYQIVARRLYN